MIKLDVLLESTEPKTLAITPILMGGLTLKIANRYDQIMLKYYSLKLFFLLQCFNLMIKIGRLCM